MALVLTVVRYPEGSYVPEMRKVFGAEGGTIGRSSDNSWQLPDPKRFVSSLHSCIRCDGGRYFLVDTSTNGTYVNNNPHPLGPGKKVRLSQGDRIFMGEYELNVEFEQPPTVSTPRTVSQTGAPTPDYELDALGIIGAERNRGRPEADPYTRVAPHATPSYADPNGTSSGIGKVPPPAQAAYADPRTVMHQAEPPTAGAYSGYQAGEMPPAQTQPTMPAMSPALGAEAVNDELIRQLGLDPSQVSPEQRARFAAVAADWIKEATLGLMSVLSARNAIKNEFRINMTSIRTKDNNPLKFAPTLDEALRTMFAQNTHAYLSGPKAVREGFQDIATHQLAVMAGMRAAFNHMMARFSPQNLQDRFDKQTVKRAILQSNKAYYWDCYEEFFKELSVDMDEAFQDFFGEEFAETYEQYMLSAELKEKK